MCIVGIYNLPRIKESFLIFSPQQAVGVSKLEIKENTREMQYLERTLQSKDHMRPKLGLRWTVSAMSQSDFLRVLKPKGIREELSNRSLCIPENLELLTINLKKTLDDSFDSLQTCKELSMIHKDEIIEVFI